jgi:hypothetical protein
VKASLRDLVASHLAKLPRCAGCEAIAASRVDGRLYCDCCGEAFAADSDLLPWAVTARALQEALDGHPAEDGAVDRRQERYYLTDDCDQDDHELRAGMGENGDWYLSIQRQGDRFTRACVRITTSGSRYPGATEAVADLYAAMKPAAGRFLVAAEPAPWQPAIGDPCRIFSGTPARYIGNGRGLGVCAQDNDLIQGPAGPPRGGEQRFPLPTDEEVLEAAGGAKRLAEEIRSPKED